MFISKLEEELLSGEEVQLCLYSSCSTLFGTVAPLLAAMLSYINLFQRPDFMRLPQFTVSLGTDNILRFVYVILCYSKFILCVIIWLKVLFSGWF